ncbi:MAG: hypothetical protein IPI44_06185 [Sulfuritalea sp.]|nr:hypothetical protein [Sulfuritalea sp.]
MTPGAMSLPPVQMLWVEGPLSALERLSIASFLANGHAVHLYTYGDVPNVPDGARVMNANEVLHDGPQRRAAQRGIGAGGWAFFSNLFRYRLLHARGGLWCDTDIVCVRPLTFAVERPRFFATERTPQASGQGSLPIRANNCAMQAPAGDPLLLECFERASQVDGDTAPWGSAGPILLTTLINERQLAADLVAPEVFCPIDHWNVSSLLQGPQLIGVETHAVHFWNEIWRRNFCDKNARYDPLSLYERLKARYLGRKELAHA